MKQSAFAFSIAMALLLPGCMTMTPATYMVSVESRTALQKYSGSKLAVAQVSGPATFEPMCRGVGNIQVGDGLTLGQFVAKGFNDEFKYAGVHSDNGIRLRGELTKAAFSSTAALVNGWWDMTLTLQSSNGQSMTIQNKYDFEAGFSGPGACNNTSRALGPAVQQLVHKTITDPRFPSLVR